jgi:hypothetical protein
MTAPVFALSEYHLSGAAVHIDPTDSLCFALVARSKVRSKFRRFSREISLPSMTCRPTRSRPSWTTLEDGAGIMAKKPSFVL